MADATTLQIEQQSLDGRQHNIQLTLQRPGQPNLKARATIEFALSADEQEEIRWYMEDYLQRSEAVEAVQVDQVEQLMRRRGEELYAKVLAANMDTQAIWFAVRPQLADLRIEVTTGVASAAAIPWELMRDPQADSPLAVRVQSFVRVQSNPNIDFVPVPADGTGRVRFLYVIARPGGIGDVALRAIANGLLQGLGNHLARFDITVLRPPTYERLQKELTNAKGAGRPYHVVHFDGHGIYEDLERTTLADWLKAISVLTLGGKRTGKHGYLMFEHPGSEHKMRPVSGEQLGQLLHDSGVPVLVLNACQSAMHQATDAPAPTAGIVENIHDEVRAIGSLAQAVIDQGIPAVLGMRYSVYVVTAAQYIGQLYIALAQGRLFGQAASEGRKHLYHNPDRWVGLEPRPLQDWFVPVIYEAAPLQLLPPSSSDLRPEQVGSETQPTAAELDPIHTNPALLRYVPDTGFIGRDETLLMLDRAFDQHPIVLLHAYAGQGKSATAVEFARWYALTGGLDPRYPLVLFSSFETHTDLNDLLNHIGQRTVPDWASVNQPDQKRQVVLRLLRQIPILWIWDNVEPVAGFPAGTPSAWTGNEQQELADFLRQIRHDSATQARILLTSRRDERDWLGGIPHRIAMPRMNRSDAGRLALEIGSEHGLERSQLAHWQPLLDYCQGNPLTLRILTGQALRNGLRREDQIAAFIQALRDGEQHIQDTDEEQGRDRSLGASLDYGFRNAFDDQEQAIIALLHLFQGVVQVAVLAAMGQGDHALPALANQTTETLTRLLDRARDTGLLTHLGGTYYTIHPALPWYLRQLFDRYYPIVARSVSETPIETRSVSEGRRAGGILVDASGADDAPAIAVLRAWVEAIGSLGSYYAYQFGEGNRSVIQVLALEEANLLHARRTARRHGWWDRLICAMEGIKSLYEYQGRLAEWSRLVAEITPDYCTPADAPVSGREDEYSSVMEYRVGLACDHSRDLPTAAALGEQRVAWSRQQAASALAQPGTAPLDPRQRNVIRSLGVSLEDLGHIQREQHDPACVASFEECIQFYARINDTAAEAIGHFNLGHAYQDIPAFRNLDSAETAYQRSLELHNLNDDVGRSRCIKQIGMVHHARFVESSQRNERAATQLQHAQAAERHYHQALALCPPTALTDLAMFYQALGGLYIDVGQADLAREHCERAIQYLEQLGNPYDAGRTRRNLSLMYVQAAERESTSTRRTDLLKRGLAYAQAALRDFQHYQGRAADWEAQAQQLIDIITRAL